MGMKYRDAVVKICASCPRSLTFSSQIDRDFFEILDKLSRLFVYKVQRITVLIYYKNIVQLNYRCFLIS